MSIKPGVICIVVRTAWPALLGKVCTCISDEPHPLGQFTFEFPDGVVARGNARNVRPITPPSSDNRTKVPVVIEAA